MTPPAAQVALIACGPEGLRCQSTHSLFFWADTGRRAAIDNCRRA